MTTLQKTNFSDSLIYKVSKTIKKEKIVVTIKLNEDCKNGYEYFSVTASGYELRNNKFDETFGGCCHDEILRFFPEFKIFTEVHLWSFGGYNMHAIANGYYFLKNGFNNCDINSENFPNYFCSYYQCSINQFNLLKNCDNQFEFSVLLIELGVIENWKKIIKNAILELEKLTGLKFKSKYDKDKNEITIDSKQLTEFKNLQKSGYFTEEQKKKRESQRLKDLKKDMINKVNLDFNKQVEKYEKEKNLCLELIKLGFEISPKTGNIKGAIYYNHSNELNFNWSTEKISIEKINYLIEKIDKTNFKGLKISNDRQILKVIE